MQSDRIIEAIRSASPPPSQQIRRTIGSKSPPTSAKDCAYHIRPIGSDSGRASPIDGRSHSPSGSVSGRWSPSGFSMKDDSIKHSNIVIGNRSRSSSRSSRRSCSPYTSPQGSPRVPVGGGSAFPYLSIMTDQQAISRSVRSESPPPPPPLPMSLSERHHHTRRMVVGGHTEKVMEVITHQPDESSRSLNSYSPVRLPQKQVEAYSYKDLPASPTEGEPEVIARTPRRSSDPGTPRKKSPLGNLNHKVVVRRRGSDPGSPKRSMLHKKALEYEAAQEAAAVDAVMGEQVSEDECIEQSATEPSHHRKKATARRHDPARCCCGCCYVSQFAQPCCPSMSWCCCLRPTEEQPIHENAARCGCYKINCCGFVSGCMLTVPVCPWNEEPTCFFGINLCYLLPIPFYRHSGGRRGNMYFSNFTNEDQFVKPGQSHYIFTDEGIEMKHEEVWCLSTNVVEDFMPEICHCQCRCQ